MLLSDRMRAVVGLVEPCDCIADIGCDHGYVAMELISNQTCKKVIAMDINYGPLELAKSHIRDNKMTDFIETRISDGTSALIKGEANGIVCAGMGGKLIIHILEEGKELIKDMQELILQPQSEIDEVRAYLRENKLAIVKEDMVCEDGKYYPMMRVVNGDKNDTSVTLEELSKEELQKQRRIEDTYGPYLLKKSHPVLKQYLLWQKENLDNIRGNLVSGRNPSPRQQTRIAELDEALSDIVFCLYNYYKTN